MEIQVCQISVRVLIERAVSTDWAVALRVTCFLVHQAKILNSRAHSRPDLIPPSLFM